MTSTQPTPEATTTIKSQRSNSIILLLLFLLLLAVFTCIGFFIGVNLPDNTQLSSTPTVFPTVATETITPTTITPTATPSIPEQTTILTHDVYQQDLTTTTYEISYDNTVSDLGYRNVDPSLSGLEIYNNHISLKLTFPSDGGGLTLDETQNEVLLKTQSLSNVFRYQLPKDIGSDRFIYSSFYAEGDGCSIWSPLPIACATTWVNFGPEEEGALEIECSLKSESATIETCDEIVKTLNLTKK